MIRLGGPIPCRRLVATIWAAAAGIMAAACTRGADSPSRDPPPLATYLRPTYRLPGIPLGNGDSLPLDGATSVALSGDVLGILHPPEGRVILIDLGRRTFRLIGRSGAGPSDVPKRSALRAKLALSPNGLVAILDENTHTLRVWDTGGQVRWTKRIGNQTWTPAGGLLRGGQGIWPLGFGIDSTGRVYVPLGDWQGELVHLSVLRIGPREGDSSVSVLSTGDGPVRFQLSGGRIGLHHIHTDYVRHYGAVYWTVDPRGVVFVGRGDSLRVDTLGAGAGRAAWLRGTQVASREVPEGELAAVLEGNSVGGRAIEPRDVMPLRYAVLQALFVTPTHVWIGLGKSAAGREYDVIHRETGAARRLVLPGLPAAVSERWVVSWATGRYGEAVLDVVDMEALTPLGSQRPSPLPLELMSSAAHAARPNPPAVPRDSTAPARPASEVGRLPVSAGIRCDTFGPPLADPRVTVVLDPGSVGESVLVAQLTSPIAPRGIRAMLGAVGGASSSCESSAEIRFTVVGALPATLSLTIASQAASVAVLRGDDLIAESVLSDSIPVRITLPNRR